MRLSGFHVPINSISASSLSMLISCPEQWRLKKIQRYPETFGVDKLIGTVDHSTHAYNLQQKIVTGEDLPLETMERIYDKKWDEAILKDGEPDWRDEEADSVIATGKKMIAVYHEKVSPGISPIRVEDFFEQKLPGIPVPIIGYMDVEEETTIIERKTAKAKIMKPKAKWTVQGRIYSMIYDKPVDFHVITKQKTPQVVTPADSPELTLSNQNHDSTFRMIEQAMFLLNDFWQRYGPDEPWPTYGVMHDWLCGYCSFGPKFGGQCPIWKENTPF